MAYGMAGLALLLGCTPALLEAQECTVLDNQSVNASNRGTPQEVYYVVGADISCPGGRRILADNATIFTATGVVDLRGRVRFADPERELTSDQAQYDRVNQRLYATGSVRVRVLASNSTLDSDNLTYEQAMPGREARMLAQPGARRPHAVLRRPGAADTLAASADPAGRTRPARFPPGRESSDATIVDADMIEVLGERYFHAVGNAVMTRDSLKASGGVIDYTTDTGALLVAQGARIEGPSYQLTGDTVTADIAADTLRAVHARRAARLQTDQVTVEAPVIDIALVGGLVERMVAVLLADERGPDVAPARVAARAFRLVADSIDVRAPAQQLEEVHAVGRAFGEMLDTLPALQLPAERGAPLENDWMRGDTLRAYFAANPEARADSAADPRVLERLVAGGVPAAALYRKRAEVTSAGTPPGAPEIGYVLANLIEVRLAEGEVSDVKAEGDVRGMYLQPRTTATAAAPAEPEAEP
jgi:lipopolysaccharide export system protein LptA